MLGRMTSAYDSGAVPEIEVHHLESACLSCTAAAGSWVVALDNLSGIPAWLSDSLCRASTGDGNVKRALYSDAGLAVVKFRRCVVINGIDLGALRGDWRHAHRECRALAYP